MRLLHGSPKKRGRSSSPNLYHALVRASTNSSIVPIGFRVQSDTDLLGDSTFRRMWNYTCSFMTGNTFQIRFPDSGKGFGHDHRPPDTPPQNLNETEERGLSSTST